MGHARARHPTQAWTAQQLRNATMDGEAPAILLRDSDDKFGSAFDRAAQGVGTKVIRTAVRAPNMNAVAERFVGSVRRELLDHVLLVDDLHLASLVRQYQRYFNESRPHQGIGQRVPTKPVLGIDSSKPIERTSVLGGLHVDYRRPRDPWRSCPTTSVASTGPAYGPTRNAAALAQAPPGGD